MSTIPDGTYGVYVSDNAALSGLLVVSGSGTTATFQGTTVTAFNSTSGSIGWTCTINSVSTTYQSGTYNAGPPATVTGGSVNGSSAGWSVPSLVIKNYAVTITDQNSLSGALNVSAGNPAGTPATATYKGQSVTNLNLTSGQIGWQVAIPPAPSPNSVTYTFSGGVFQPGATPQKINGGSVGPFPNNDDETWTAEANVGEVEMYAKAGA